MEATVPGVLEELEGLGLVPERQVATRQGVVARAHRQLPRLADLHLQPGHLRADLLAVRARVMQR
jgi:hypothetical protein